MNWFYKNKKMLKFTRALSLYTNSEYTEELGDITKLTLGPGYGKHFFFYNKKLMWMNLLSLDSSGSELQKRSIKITCLGRNKNIFDEFIKEFSPKEKENTLHLYTFEKQTWEKESTLQNRSLESVALDADIKTKLIEKIMHFNTQEDWFIQKGLAYKLTFLLHGIPGTGKTSIIRALASHFKKNICIIAINSMSDAMFQSALTKAPSNSIIIIEDFDSVKASKNRTETKKSDSLKLDFDLLSLTGILNGLDGIKSLHDVIIFLTTNHLELIDPALYRKGRVDYIVELKETSAAVIKKYSKYVFPNYNFDKYRFKDTLGCNLNSALLISEGDPEKYLKELKIEKF